MSIMMWYNSWILVFICDNFLILLFVGLWPLLSIMSSEDSDLNVNVLQVTRGVPSYKTITFTYNGIKAPPVKVGAEAAEVNRWWSDSSITQNTTW